LALALVVARRLSGERVLEMGAGSIYASAESCQPAGLVARTFRRQRRSVETDPGPVFSCSANHAILLKRSGSSMVVLNPQKMRLDVLWRGS
jgi:hypothetical protein